jgi:hypothetical protein
MGENAMAENEKTTSNPRSDGPLHRPSGKLDAGSSDESNDSIVKPSGNLHSVKPTPGSEAPGQTTKM